MRVAFFTQYQVDELATDTTPLQHIAERMPGASSMFVPPYFPHQPSASSAPSVVLLILPDAIRKAILAYPLV